MAETLLLFGFEKLWELLVRESDRFKGVDEQFTELKRELEKLRIFLRDADIEKHRNEMVRNTVKVTKEILYDAEDIIETFILKEELWNTGGIKKRIRQLACIMADRWKISFEMKFLSKRIAKVISDMHSHSTRVNDNATYMQYLRERQREIRQTFSSDNEDHLVGLERNIEILVGKLMEEDSCQVVCITGMGGIGKTTLARQVFNHEKIKSHFSRLAWVCVSQKLTRKYVWQTILRKLMPGHKESEMTEDELQEKIHQFLETQKALIVLDDIWTQEDWNIIKPMFPRKRGWKVLLTSRNEGVTTGILREDLTCLEVDCLTPQESWTLFRRIASPKENTTDVNVDVEMEEAGKKIIKHCGGLPLALKVLGGLLATKYTWRDWKKTNEIIKYLIAGDFKFNGRDMSSVYSILYLSYEELPIYLKHCFLYLAHFPEYYEIDVENLSYYWAAEGIPRPRYHNGASIQEVTDGYIEELVERSMVISERDKTSRFTTCRLHEMLREVCLRSGEEENFLQIVDASTGSSSERSKSRRLVVHSSDSTCQLDGYLQNPSLRSLLFIHKISGLNWTASGLSFRRLQLLRVLDLSRAEFKGGKLPSSIGKLIHLRYLSLYMANVSYLPSSMRNLKLLLYLNLRVGATSPVNMPNFLKEMQKLSYLFLPDNMQDKTKLVLGNLINLETLENFSTKHNNVEDLQGMTKLNTLSILFDCHVCSVETLATYVSELRHLQNLTITDKSASDARGFVLGCVLLKQLKLSIHMPNLPDDQHFPSRLTSICLRHCLLEEDPMPILEKLLHLKKVELWDQSFAGRRIVCSSGGFPQLHQLELSGLKELEEWIVEEGSMPLLHTLSISHCDNLKELPDGLRFITSLMELSCGYMGSKWEERLSEGGKDYYKVQHIPLLIFNWA